MAIKIIKDPISREELKKIATEGFGDIVKAVVDIKQGVMAVGGELHADEEVILIEREDSSRENTWGVNLYTEKSGDEFIEFDSMVNIKPALGNRSRSVEDTAVRKQIAAIVQQLIKQ